MVLRSMRERLKGIEWKNAYDLSDRVFDELSLKREQRKLERVFGSANEVLEAFSSIKGIKAVKEELKFEQVNQSLLSELALAKSAEVHVDQVDFYRSFVFGEPLLTKEVRVKKSSENLKIENNLESVVDCYLSNHFDFLKISKEMIQLSDGLGRLFRERKLVSVFDEMLGGFYGVRV